MNGKAEAECRSVLDSNLRQLQFVQGPPGVNWRLSTSMYMAEPIVYKNVKNWMRESNVGRFLHDHIQRHVQTHISADDPLPYSLIEKVGEAGIAAIIQSIVDDIKSLPLHYYAAVYLPRLEPTGIREIKICAGVSLVEKTGDEALDLLRLVLSDAGQQRIASSAEEAAGAARRASQAAAFTGVFLVVEAHGYYTPRNPTANALANQIKRVIGLSLAVDILELNYRDDVRRDSTLGYRFEQDGEEWSTLVVFDHRDDSLVDLRRLSSPMYRLINFVDVARSKLLLQSGRKVSDKVSTSDFAALISNRLVPVGVCLSDDGPHIESLTAAEWSFDSAAIRVENETFAYLFSAIGLESVLGSPSEETMQRLADRLSYLVGATREERKAILKNFKIYYEHRSKIVHGTATSLTEKQVEAMIWGQSMLRRALARELELTAPVKRTLRDQTSRVLLR